MKKILILGSGLVARPMIRYLLEQSFYVTVASNTPDRALEMIGGDQNGESVDWDAKDEESLSKMIAGHDIVVSLLPFAFHAGVAALCVNHKKNMVTTSYVRPEMKALDQPAKEAGIILLNELGLDPGIDHMSAMRIIDHIHEKQGAVMEFYSFCGALPAPEAIDNPFGYKFSWSPKGVLIAGTYDAKYLKDGEIVNIAGADLFKNPIIVNCPDAGILEVYPNRDSLPYRELYGIPESRTLLRGTFRNQGWCEILDYMKSIGLFSFDQVDMTGMTYADLMNHGTTAPLHHGTTAPLHHGTTAPLHHGTTPPYISALQWLGLYEDIPMNRYKASPFDVVSDMMIGKMSLKPEERDMIVMQHTFLAGYSDGRKEVIRSRMVDFGIPGGDTAIARTVALPAAMGVEMILQGEIRETGVHIPVIPAIYNPILDRLETMGIRMEEEYGLSPDENIHA